MGSVRGDGPLLALLRLSEETGEGLLMARAPGLDRVGFDRPAQLGTVDRAVGRADVTVGPSSKQRVRAT